MTLKMAFGIGQKSSWVIACLNLRLIDRETFCTVLLS